VDVLDVGEVVQVTVAASEHEPGGDGSGLAGFCRARCRVAALVVEAGSFGPVLVHVLELERAAARGTKSGETPAVGAAHPPRERAHRYADTVGLLLVGTADALFQVRGGPQLSDLGAEELADPLQEPGLGQVGDLRLAVVPVVEAPDDDAYVGEVDEGPDASRVHERIGPL
jgi:hypothetical protein